MTADRVRSRRLLPPAAGTSATRRTASSALRLVLAWAAMSAAYVAGTTVIGPADIAMTPEEMQQAGRALFVVSAVTAAVLSFLVVRSRWHGLRLVGAVAFVHFGVETFMAQVETLYFNGAVRVETAAFVGIVAAGSVRASIFAPLAVIIFGKLRRPPAATVERPAAAPPGRGVRLAAVAVLYVLVYFVFGYFVAWQWEETRLFYSSTTDIEPFFAHFAGLFAADPFIVPFQLLRGALWGVLAYVIVRMVRARRWEASLAVAATFAALLAVPLGLFPNPYMPPAVVRSHVFEITSSMLLFGAVAGWILHGGGVTDGRARTRPPSPAA